VSYPSIFIGSNNGRSSAGSGLPLAVSSITKTGINTSWSWTKSSSTTGSYNAAYDVWFSTSSGGDAAGPSGGYMMVWFHMPSTDYPIGGNGGQPNASGTVAGKTWNIWYGNNSGDSKPCVSYVAQTEISSMTFNLGEFINDAVTRGYVKSSWYLTNVFSGFEIWSGGNDLQTTDFTVSVP
jgi:cellulose 1,4-beta-cellobiosidase